VESIQIQMAPGNRGARHTGTIASLMHSVGQPFSICRNGRFERVLGWSEPREFDFPTPIGKRRGYLIDVPDHEFFSGLFGKRTVEFRSWSELQILNGCISVLCRMKRNWVSWSRLLRRAMGLLSWIGHDWGGIGVEVSGDIIQRAYVIADSRAERIAVMPACVMTAAFLCGVENPGVNSYNAWLTEDELRVECERRGFRLVVERV